MSLGQLESVYQVYVHFSYKGVCIKANHNFLYHFSLHIWYVCNFKRQAVVGIVWLELKVAGRDVNIFNTVIVAEDNQCKVYDGMVVKEDSLLYI